MIEIYKTINNEPYPCKMENIEKGCWINIVSPTEEEINYIESSLNVYPNFLRDPLDEEEKPRIDVEDNGTLVIVDVPYIYEENNNLKFETLPLGILIMDDYFLTICSKETFVIENFKNRRVKDFYTFKKTRFTLQILFMIAKDFLKYLRHIDKKSDEAEKSLHKSMRNKELIKLMELEKSLVFFTTSLKSNEIVMEKLLKGKYIKLYEEDQDLLEDVIIENRQAIEMANIYSSILSGMMDAFASIISNNQNVVMKFLTSVTIVMAIPTMIASFFGMNVQMPFGWNGDAPHAFWIIMGVSAAISVVTTLILYKRDMF
ncbi:MAG TPA: magnesium transporter CorA family protein [Acetivibrio sp.]|jgi:magnesium transporter|nr:magnesium transporter CorA family protein [Clostridium sp.]HOQ37712.1 magnesium transporter CorA family protein [Acetivibrio sp.]HPT91736.1 magnesium transporter CorA family protein [Acetivibrio sp.]HQA58483.1 magnesium transporter CorA family protein [Acetivibrio sp.]